VSKHQPIPEDEGLFRLRPPKKSRRAPDEVRLWCHAFQKVERLVRMSRHIRRPGHTEHRAHAPYLQRCSVRVTYSKNKSSGQWRAHGRYLERESAVMKDGEKAAGFNAGFDAVDIGSTLDSWQKQNDEVLFRMIVSPEFGDQLNVERHTRELMAGMERDLHTELEWVAAAHFNTDHPHVHVAIRGKNDRGQSLHLPRPYIKSGIRQHAQELATNQIGYRTQTQVLQAQSREVQHQHKTSLDDLILRQLQPGNQSWSRIQPQTPVHIAAWDDVKDRRAQLLSARLRALQTMGLAVQIDNQSWAVRQDFQEVLKAMQKVQDRQKVIAKHGVLTSDPRLPVELTSMRDLQYLEGRVLVHDEDPQNGRPYLLLEGTDAKIHMIYHDNALSQQRALGKLRPGHFITLRKQFTDKKPTITVDDLGAAEGILSDAAFLQKTSKWRIRHGLIEVPQDWGGWLGQYYSHLNKHIQTQVHRSISTNRGL
jgi:type IV secretory pathway VirD2 relaxase